ncbi:hypothetical protein PR048_013784 [Dryococelus australis]|uniref:Uncharacterized protein n=1 Tax=Dryococelus australis TaxID=614101 RepID=A0ABQ9HT53_9NEOP|nr:hypothetical protein PR048_013784 [Dryococelus australis]
MPFGLLREHVSSYQLLPLSPSWGRGCVVIRLLASHLGEPGSIPGGFAPRFSQVGIVPDDVTGRQVFSDISRFPRPSIPALIHTHLASPSSALKISITRVAESRVGESNRVMSSDTAKEQLIPAIIQFEIGGMEWKSIPDDSSGTREKSTAPSALAARQTQSADVPSVEDYCRPWRNSIF